MDADYLSDLTPDDFEAIYQAMAYLRDRFGDRACDSARDRIWECAHPRTHLAAKQSILHYYSWLAWIADALIRGGYINPPVVAPGEGNLPDPRFQPVSPYIHNRYMTWYYPSDLIVWACRECVARHKAKG